jgi:hypothetical protein
MIEAAVCQQLGHSRRSGLGGRLPARAVVCALMSVGPPPGVAAAQAVADDARAPATDELTIEHHPVRCLVAGKYPQLDACIVPVDRVARARVYFRPASGTDWYYVEMKQEAGCYRGILPRPSKSLEGVEYYVAATALDFAAAQTEEYRTRVVPDGKSCRDGPVAPFVTSASVVVGGLAGALPAGFAVGGVAAGVTTAVVAGVVGAGAAGAAIATGGGGGEETTTTSTTPRPTTTTTTVAPSPTTTTTTTTTTLPGGCGQDSAPPDVQFVQPQDNASVGATIEIEVDAVDPGPVTNGIREVRLSAREQGGPRTATIAVVPGPGPVFRASWVLLPCVRPQDHWYLLAQAVDGCGRTSVDQVRVKRTKESCDMTASTVTAASRAEPAPGREPGEGASGSVPLVWTSELSVPGAQGQVVANGTDLAFPGPGRSQIVLPVHPGRNRVEATLVDATGREGTWRFAPAAGTVSSGSLRILAGEVAALGADAVAFRLRGRPGERVVFTFDAE